MKSFIPAVFLVLALLSSGLADPVPELEVDGRKYTAATVTLVSPSEARISHSGGIRNIDPALLPETIRTALGYDPDAALAHRKQLAAAQQAAAAKIPPAEAKATWLWVIENRKDGILVGHYDTRSQNIGGSSIGNGNGGSTITTRTKNHRMAWIPHNAATREMAVDTALHLLTTPDGTHRIDDQTVVTKYRWHGIVPEKKPAK